jgi:putative PIN family toxin of toxin-antitoxin system
VRIVLDTASFVTAVRSRTGAAREVVDLILDGDIIPLMDVKMGLEYRDVALRTEHLAASRLSKAGVLELIEAIEALAESVEILEKHRPLSSDPNDDMILDVAINGRADALVTNNTKHFAAVGKRYAISVFTPAELLRTIRKGEQNGN